MSNKAFDIGEFTCWSILRKEKTKENGTTDDHVVTFNATNGDMLRIYTDSEVLADKFMPGQHYIIKGHNPQPKLGV